ncbi:hypothetical protein [Fodinibius saliphilus]|uniref:hypothetical protein n=1 Tax=Fodinibius saliphilus TaxID=1920650 RepID=UPI0011080C96|nr:hypothetical protein [Fodinibius saliphilus]
MDFIFQGFQSTLPLWTYVLIFISTTLLSWWAYKEHIGISPIYRYLLIALRSLVFVILLILLLNPFIKTETSYLEKPSIAVMLDNSASTAIQKKSYKGVESYQETLDRLELRELTDLNLEFYSIGNTLAPVNLDSLTLDAEQTNLSSAINFLNTNQHDINTAILISDGIYTQGQNPVFNSGNLDIPVFTVGLGDSTTQEDLLVRSISTNSTGYIDTPQPLAVTISSNGFRDQSFSVQLQNGDTILESRTVTPDLDSDIHEITFELVPKEEGLQQYTIVIPPLQDEWTSSNNTKRFSVDVKDAKQSIVSLAFEVHPDVKYMRSLLRSDKNTELTNRTWITGNRFIEGAFNISADTVDLAIIHGYPRSGLPANLEDKVKQLANEIPIIIFATPLFAIQQFEQNVRSLPIRSIASWEYVEVGLLPQENASSHPVMNLPALKYNQLPYLWAPIDNITTSATATQLFSSSYRDGQTNKPVLSVQETGNRRISFFSSYGWYQLNQINNKEIKNFASELLLNVVSWTATDPNNQLLKVEPAKTTFSGTENIIIDAYLENERGEMETNASVDLSLSADTLENRFYSMENIGSGRYRIDLGHMAEGIYSFKAVAQKGGRQIDTQQGEFAVSKSNAEFINTSRNDQLLRTLADQSGGSYVTFDSVSSLWPTLRQQDLLKQQQKTETSFFYLYRNAGWFIVVILLLSCEWIIRKYLSLP